MPFIHGARLESEFPAILHTLRRSSILSFVRTTQFEDLIINEACCVRSWVTIEQLQHLISFVQVVIRQLDLSEPKQMEALING